MSRYNEIKKAYRVLGGGSSFYDGMMTCSTLLGKLVCKLVWDMNQADTMAYQHCAIAGIPRNFSERLLEVPVGTGVLTMPLYQQMPQADITCLDYSASMLAKAERRAKEMHLHHVQCQQGDVGNLPYADASFDVVLSMNGFHAFPDKEAAYREVHRVLKPGGLFCGCFYIKYGCKRTDWFIQHLYEPKGFFTPPYETRRSLENRFKQQYQESQVEVLKGMVSFCCKKGEE